MCFCVCALYVCLCVTSTMQKAKDYQTEADIKFCQLTSCRFFSLSAAMAGLFPVVVFKEQCTEQRVQL